MSDAGLQRVQPFERKGATPQDMLFWMQLLERREVIHLEFTRIDDPA